GFNSLVHSLRALSALRRSGLRTASTAAKPCQGDILELYLITGRILTVAAAGQKDVNSHLHTQSSNLSLINSKKTYNTAFATLMYAVMIQDRPLPTVVSPTVDSPVYIFESDHEEDDEDLEEDPTDYPTDRNDDNDDAEEEEEDSFKDNADNKGLKAKAPSTSHQLPSSTPSSRTPLLLHIPLPTSSPPLLLPSTSHRADVLEDDRVLMSGEINMLRRDRRAHARTTRHRTARFIENEAILSHKAWVQSMDASDTARAEVMSLCTAVLPHQSKIEGLQVADRTRQTQLVEALTLLKTLQTQVAAL
nr:hypothetical protein [Tanacetum cinerariifolium]